MVVLYVILEVGEILKGGGLYFGSEKIGNQVCVFDGILG